MQVSAASDTELVRQQLGKGQGRVEVRVQPCEPGGGPHDPWLPAGSQVCWLRNLEVPRASKFMHVLLRAAESAQSAGCTGRCTQEAWHPRARNAGPVGCTAQRVKLEHMTVQAAAAIEHTRSMPAREGNEASSDPHAEGRQAMPPHWRHAAGSSADSVSHAGHAGSPTSGQGDANDTPWWQAAVLLPALAEGILGVTHCTPGCISCAARTSPAAAC